MFKLVQFVGNVAAFGFRVVVDSFRSPFEGAQILRQIVEVGSRSLPLVIASGFALGTVMTLHTRSTLVMFGAAAMIPSVQALAFFIEIGPLVVGLLLAGRVGSGIGAVLANMRATEQIDGIESLSIDAFKFLVVPNQQRRCLIAAHHPRRRHPGQMHLLHLSGECFMSGEQVSDPRPAVAFDHVHKAFGPKQVLKDVSFQVAQGEILCILGRSGTGKSVTLKLLMALIKPDQGHIWVDGDDITTLKEAGLSRVRRKMGFLFQDAALFDSLTLYENLVLPLHRLTTKSKDEIDAIADKVLRQVGLANDKKKMPAELSGGMRKRAGLARALVLEPKILLADEPSSGLDRITASEIDELLLRQKAESQTTVIVVTHDVHGAGRVGDRFAVFDKGDLVAFGTAAEVEQSEHETARKLISEQ